MAHLSDNSPYVWTKFEGKGHASGLGSGGDTVGDGMAQQFAALRLAEYRPCSGSVDTLECRTSVRQEVWNGQETWIQAV